MDSFVSLAEAKNIYGQNDPFQSEEREKEERSFQGFRGRKRWEKGQKGIASLGSREATYAFLHKHERIEDCQEVVPKRKEKKKETGESKEKENCTV